MKSHEELVEFIAKTAYGCMRLYMLALYQQPLPAWMELSSDNQAESRAAVHSMIAMPKFVPSDLPEYQTDTEQDKAAQEIVCSAIRGLIAEYIDGVPA